MGGRILAPSITTISGTANVTASGGNVHSSNHAQSMGGHGFYSGAQHSLNIGGNATVIANGGSRTGNPNVQGGAGIAFGTVMIGGNASVTASGGNAEESGTAAGGAGILVRPGNNLQITESATISAFGGNNASGIGGDSGPGTIAISGHAVVHANRGLLTPPPELQTLTDIPPFPRSLGRRAADLTMYTIHIAPTASVFANGPMDVELTPPPSPAPTPSPGASPAPSPSPAPCDCLPGDFNGDGLVNILDLTELRMYLAGVPPSTD